MPRLTFFHLFYSTTFTLLSLLTLTLVLVPPGDAIAQALQRSKQLYNVFVIAGVYVLTAIVAVTIYTARMYTFRRLLADIPKSHALVGKADLPRRVHAAVTRGISRSAYVSLISRPKEGAQGEAVWGHINHPGWAPPGGELKGVEYRTIVLELPALLEMEAAKVAASGGSDPGVVMRQPYMTLRQWMENLCAMELVPKAEAEEFVTLYERTRFRSRGKGIEEMEFRELMRALKGVLTGMGTERAHGQGAWRYATMGSDEEMSEVERVDTMGYGDGSGPAFAGYETNSSADSTYPFHTGSSQDLSNSRRNSNIPIGADGRPLTRGTMSGPMRRKPRPDSSITTSSSSSGGSVIHRNSSSGASVLYRTTSSGNGSLLQRTNSNSGSVLHRTISGGSMLHRTNSSGGSVLHRTISGGSLLPPASSHSGSIINRFNGRRSSSGGDSIEMGSLSSSAARRAQVRKSGGTFGNS
ncbi:hypothetical protein FPQ18DRAFT_313253 [Pyronema domesticum]|nr:hypothetical protein FPQ18DRAFT_313253 [Pyronema domesticum]